jgi:SNF2 family DNA or RNA helicase
LRRCIKALYPFQLQGVKYGLARNGRCLIADQMGVGKTIQAGGSFRASFQPTVNLLLLLLLLLRASV